MKNTIILIILGTGLFLASCANMDPEYKAYKEQKAAEAKAQQDTLNNNPYGAPQSQTDANSATQVNGATPLPGNYGVPSNSGITGSVNNSQLQSIPPIPGAGGTATSPLEVSGGQTMVIPSQGSATTSIPGQSITHTVVANDTLWGLSKKYNVSIYDIRIANNITSDTIIIGQKILIPQQ